MKDIKYIILVLLVTGIMGCSNKEEKTDFTSKTDDVKKTDVTFKKDDDKKIVVDSSTNKLPDDFPLDFPQYKDSKILSTTKTSSSTAVTFEINDNVKVVSDFYKSEMIKNGYKAEKDNEMMMSNKGGIITFSKGGKDFELKFRYNDAASKTLLILSIR